MAKSPSRFHLSWGDSLNSLGSHGGEVADPMIEAQKWVRRSLRALREELGQAGHDASAPTVSRLLKKHDSRVLPSHAASRSSNSFI